MTPQARGLVFGLLFSILIWVFIGFCVYVAVHA